MARKYGIRYKSDKGEQVEEWFDDHHSMLLAHAAAVSTQPPPIDIEIKDVETDCPDIDRKQIVLIGTMVEHAIPISESTEGV